jgi:glucose/arabinose dehydrogenase
MPIYRQFVPLATLLLVTTGAGPSAAEPSASFDSEVLADGLRNPWGLDFLPDGDVIVTERPGRMRLLSDGALSEPIAGVPKVAARGQGGFHRCFG